MSEKKTDLDAIEMVDFNSADGMCGPDGCSIEDHRKMVAAQEKVQQEEEK